ncbi:DUF6268 family outer membrane beta-barrel protein [Marinifilum fragile]|uniref:DUF6268 family outer membrane beta-barrel protein n=1 Tax=Marinifilum fragile TaxID=570161 RepID=UPI002AA86B18|nr:DUF6268 family outer membrane beta-barrel protein [Marinifilum fragile]
MKKILLITAIVLGVILPSQAQMLQEKFGADYVFVGKGDSDNGNDISFEKYEFRFSIHKKLKTPGRRIFHTFNYAGVNIDYGSTALLETNLKNFHTISYTFGYARPLKKGWYLTAFIKPNISSNFESSISFDELNLFGMALFSKPINQKKNMILSLGAIYSNTIGVPAPIPVVSLNWKPNKKWNINFGFPMLDVNYKASEKTTLGANLFIAVENFTLTDKLVYNNETSQIDNVSIMNFGGGLLLKQKLSKKISLNINSGYTLYRNFEFKDGSDKIADFDLDNNLFLKAGITVSI